MKKFISVLSLLLVFCFCVTLASCVNDGGEDISNDRYVIDFSQSQAKRVQLRIWMDDDDSNLMLALEKDYEAKNANIDLVFQHMATVDARERLKTYGQSGNGADIFQFPHDHMAQAILDDLVYQLSDDLKESLEEQMNPVAMDIATVAYNDTTKEFESTGTEHLYAVPISLESVALYYNVDLLQQIWGDTYRDHIPATFEDFISDMGTYTAMDKTSFIAADKAASDYEHYFATSSHWADQYFVQFIYSAFGFRPFGENGNDDSMVGFESESLTNALTWMYNTLRPAIGSTNHNTVAGQTKFEQGTLPFVLTGPWAISTFRNAGINFEVTTLPTINGEATGTFAGAQMLAAYKYSNHLAEAQAFLEYMASVEAQEILYQQEGDLPALKESNLELIDGLSTDQALQATIEQLKTSIPMPTIPAVTYYWGPGETMVTNIWNSNASITEQQATAENSYAAKKNGAE